MKATTEGAASPQMSRRSSKEIKPPKCQPQEPFYKRVTAFEKRAIAAEKERTERAQLVNVKDFFLQQANEDKEYQHEQQVSKVDDTSPLRPQLTKLMSGDMDSVGKQSRDDSINRRLSLRMKGKD